tara:strand:- start:146 stop:310 length:165 start_codon:yes stop_codon:yes gene_type:complete
MKNLEDQIVNAHFRADQIKKYNSDPGEDWEEIGLFGKIIYGFVIYGVIKTFVLF